MRKRLLLLILISLLCAAATENIFAAERAYNVLFVQSYNNRTPWHSQLTRGVREGLKAGGVSPNIVIEYLDADFWNYSAECVIMRRICDRARQRGTDLIVTAGDEAFFTLMNCGDSLPYQLPVVTFGIKYPDEELMRQLPNVCGYTSKINFVNQLQEALRLFPQRTDVICVSDSSFLSLKGVSELEKVWGAFQRHHPEYTLKVMNVQTQAPNPVIASICYDYNAYNRIVIAPKWTPFLSFIGRNSKAPVFVGQNTALMNGGFCAFDIEPYQGAFAAGQQAAEVLRGTSPVDLGVEDYPGKLLYDFKQLEYFKVDVSEVEDRGEVINTPLGERYRLWLVLSYSIVLATLVLLVVWLFRLNRRESRRRMHAQTRLLIQNRLVEQRDEFDNIFCSIRDGLITYDTDFRIHFVNQALILMLKLDPDVHGSRSYEGQMAGSIFHIYLDGEEILHSLLQQVHKEQCAIPIPEKSFMQSVEVGVYFPVSGEIVPIFSKGKMTGMAISSRNISEEEMQRQFFNLALDESSVYPWQYDMRACSFHFAAGMLDHFGLPDKLSILRDELELLALPEDLEKMQKHFTSIFRGESQNTRISFRLRNGNGFYEWWEFRSTSYNGLNPETPYMMLGICQSIQRYKTTEAELIAARDRAMQADMLKSAFLANMSHEIRTPLNAIVGFSDLLKDVEAFEAEEVKQFVDTININCTLLLTLINDILDLSRIESGSMDFCFAGFNLTFVMQQIYDSHRLSMPNGVELVMKIPEEGKALVTDSVRLKQVISNFINNAKKFTVQGSITFGYETEEPGYTVFFVEDTGSGISKENQQRIFERFYKVDSFTQGAGLGLSICQTIVDRFHGTIAVSSELGKGTRFTVRVPDINE